MICRYLEFSTIFVKKVKKILGIFTLNGCSFQLVTQSYAKTNNLIVFQLMEAIQKL